MEFPLAATFFSTAPPPLGQKADLATTRQQLSTCWRFNVSANDRPDWDHPHELN